MTEDHHHHHHHQDVHPHTHGGHHHEHHHAGHHPHDPHDIFGHEPASHPAAPSTLHLNDHSIDHSTLIDPHAAADAIWHGVEAAPSPAPAPPAIPDAHSFDALNALNQVYAPSLFPGFHEFNAIHGTPTEDMKLWEQQHENMSCAVATTDMLFRSFGFHFGEEAFADLFKTQGIYDPATGTNVHLMADVLNHAASDAHLNVRAVEVPNFQLRDLEQMLDASIRPLVAVNASELYNANDRFLNSLGIIPDAGHAVQLTGIIENSSGSFAVINDPGVPQGAGMQLPLDVFMHAASKIGFDAVALFPTA